MAKHIKLKTGSAQGNVIHDHTYDPDKSGKTSSDDGHSHSYQVGDSETSADGLGPHTHKLATRPSFIFKQVVEKLF